MKELIIIIIITLQFPNDLKVNNFRFAYDNLVPKINTQKALKWVFGSKGAGYKGASEQRDKHARSKQRTREEVA